MAGLSLRMANRQWQTGSWERGEQEEMEELGGQEKEKNKLGSESGCGVFFCLHQTFSECLSHSQPWC